MAIDTAVKRRAVAHISRVWSGKGITPDVTKPQAWRQVVGWSYYGILANSVSARVKDVYILIRHWHARS